jgi:hypothetical protein
MASIKDKVAYATAVTKWKVDQQVRIVRAQNSAHDLENQVRAQKAVLADTTLLLFANHKLVEEELISMCEKISQIHDQIQHTNQAIESIKQEQPPADQTLYSSMYPPTVNPSVKQEADVSSLPLSGLVCPECGMALVGRFCQVHGKEGIPLKTS